MQTSLRRRIGWWLAVLTLSTAMTAAAEIAHVRTLIFPETAAISLGAWVLRKPDWLRKPWHMVVLPTVCAAFGVFVNHVPVSTPVREVLVLWVVLVILAATRSSVSPAISAGVLPIVLNIHTWIFVDSVFLTTGLVWISARKKRVTTAPTPGSAPHLPWWTNADFAVIATLWIIAAGSFGMRDVVLPPLMVFLYESMRAKPERLGSVARQITVVIVAAVAAAWGAAILPDPVAVAAVSLIVTTGAMRLLHTWILPACAVALLPLVIPMSPISKFPILVAVLTVSASAIGLLRQRWPQYRARYAHLRS